MNTYDITCMIVGDDTADKTGIMLSYMSDVPEFNPFPIFDTYVAQREIDGQKISMHIWNSPGWDELKTIRQKMCLKCDVVLMCFSIINPDSFKHVLNKWHDELHESMLNKPVILVGTHSDKRDDESLRPTLSEMNVVPISYAQGIQLAKQIGAVTYLECSSHTHAGVKDVFEAAARAVLAGFIAKKGLKKRTCTLI